MRKVTRAALWMFVFSIPWGVVESVFTNTSITRFLGLAAVAAGLLTAVAQGRLRAPGPIFWVAAAFVSFAILSQTWTIAAALSTQSVFTYVQFLGLIWLMGEFVRTRDEHEWMMLAFWCGALFLAVDLLWNYSAGGSLSRYTATGFNPNYVAFTLVVGFPMVLRRFSTPGVVRALAFAYCVVAPIALLLTGSRSAIIAGGVVLSIVAFSGRRLSAASLAPVAAIAVAAALAVTMLMPQQTLNRVLSTKADVESGYLGGRGEIWIAGWTVFLERPVLGAGTGAFLVAVADVLEPIAGHNTPLTLLVEVGVVGLALFVGLILTCAWTIAALRPPDRTLWIALTACWLILAMAHDSHQDKVTWLLLALLAAQHGLSRARHQVTDDAPNLSYEVLPESLRPHAHRI